jgi:hypothetical protein
LTIAVIRTSLVAALAIETGKMSGARTNAVSAQQLQILGRVPTKGTPF